jgi:hypothetical protein
LLGTIGHILTNLPAPEAVCERVISWVKFEFTEEQLQTYEDLVIISASTKSWMPERCEEKGCHVLPWAGLLEAKPPTRAHPRRAISSREVGLARRRCVSEIWIIAQVPFEGSWAGVLVQSGAATAEASQEIIIFDGLRHIP